MKEDAEKILEACRVFQRYASGIAIGEEIQLRVWSDGVGNLVLVREGDGIKIELMALREGHQLEVIEKFLERAKAK